MGGREKNDWIAYVRAQVRKKASQKWRSNPRVDDPSRATPSKRQLFKVKPAALLPSCGGSEEDVFFVPQTNPKPSRRAPALPPASAPLLHYMGRNGGYAAEGDGSSAVAAGPTPSSGPPSSPDIGALAAEAMTFGEDGNEEPIDVKVQKALECPCLDQLKKGPCGRQFVDAFSCYLKSSKEEKGSDCVKPFIALQNCIKANQEAFTKEILEEEENDEEAEKSNLKVLPPAWSREPKSKK